MPSVRWAWLAYTRYKNAENYVALFMDVAVEPATGQFDESRVTSVDWATYSILRFPDAPAVGVRLRRVPFTAARIKAALADVVFRV